MSAMWHRTLVYLGLKEEPEEGYDDPPERLAVDDRGEVDERGGEARRRESARTSSRGSRPSSRGAVGADPTTRMPSASDDETNVHSLRTGDVTLRPAPSSASRVAVVEVIDFEDVEAVGARYRTGQPVCFDASDAEAATARRVVDFVSGLTYALRGQLTKVGGRAFLLVPEGAAVSDTERARLRELGYRLPAGRGA